MRNLILALAVVALIPLASGAAYLKLGDIKGEATDRGNDIDVLAWSWGMVRQRGDTVLGDVVVVRELDKSSTKLMAAATSDTEILSMQLRQQQSDSFFDIFIDNARVTSYQITSDGDVVTEEVSFSYSKISFEYSQQRADGSFDTEIVSLQA